MNNACARPFTLWLVNDEDKRFAFADVATVQDGRRLWKQVAGVDAGQRLVGFDVCDGDGMSIYSGNYTTDEC